MKQYCLDTAYFAYYTRGEILPGFHIDGNKLVFDNPECGDCNGGPCFETEWQGNPTKCDCAVSGSAT